MRPSSDRVLGSDQQSATRRLSGSETAIITLPVHPLRNRPLRILRVIGGTATAPGVRHLDLLGPKGHVVRVPASWTDLALPDEALSPSGGANHRVSVASLLMLVRLVEGLDHRKLGQTPSNMTMPDAEPLSRGQRRGKGTKSDKPRGLGGLEPAEPGARFGNARDRRAATAAKRDERGGRR
jgi:hypothetical protein